MFSKIISSPSLLLSAFLPLSAFAAATPSNFKELVTLILRDIFTPLVMLIIGLAFVTFLWGIYKYITVASTEGKEGARATIIYGLIGLAVMLSVWGLVQILTATFGFSGLLIPQLQSQ